MVLSWTRRKGFRFTLKEKENSNADLDLELVTPSHFRCPISLDLMKDPVTLVTGITYDRESIEKWIEAGNQTCPVTNQVLRSFDQIPNHSIMRMIQHWCVDNKCFGIERIPTPRIPVSPIEVLDICKKLKAATQRGDVKKCREMVGKIKAWGKESERNKKCLLDNAVDVVLCNAFESFSSSVERHSALLEEILSVLTWIFPNVGQEGQAKLGSAVSLHSMVWFLNVKDLTVRQNAAVVLKHLACLDHELQVEALMKIEGLAEALVKSVGEPVGPTATKASLTVMLHMIFNNGRSNKRVLTRFVELGLVPLLLEILVDAEKNICEKALGVLDGVCDCQEGREIAKRNALTIPLIVKKILRVSVLGSEFSVSILWKLCQKENEDAEGGAVLMEALQLGAFQKLLVVLQVGCDERTKGKSTELLKLLNTHKREVECVDSSLEFKYLKKPF